MTNAITVETQGRRHYLKGNTYPLRDQLRAAGAKWDPDAKAWWTGKRDVAEQLAGTVSAAPAAAPAAPGSDRGAKLADKVGDDTAVFGRGVYKSREYLILWMGRTARGEAAKLAFLDGSSVFWADADAVRVTKRYETRFDRYQQRERPMTFGRLRRLREEYAEEKATSKAEEKREKDPRETDIRRRASSRHDRTYDVGRTLRVGNVAGGGGPDGHYWTIVSCDKPWRNEDADVFDWTETARVRPATDEEAAPVAARIELAARKKALDEKRAGLVRELTEIVARPENARTTAEEASAHSATVGTGRHVTVEQASFRTDTFRLADDGSVWRILSHSDYETQRWVTQEARAVEIMEWLLVTPCTAHDDCREHPELGHACAADAADRGAL